METNNQPLTTQSKGNKAALMIGTTVITTLVLTSAAFGAFIYTSNSSKEKEIKDLNTKIDQLRSEKKALETSSSNVIPTNRATTSKVPSDWVKFEDKVLYGISFYHPKDWVVNSEKATPNNTAGNYISVIKPNSNIDAYSMVEFLQTLDNEKDACPSGKTCTLSNVMILGNSMTIDISGDTTNDGVLPVNPRVKTGVNGYIQFMVPLVTQDIDEETQNVKMLLESIEYN